MPIDQTPGPRYPEKAHMYEQINWNGAQSEMNWQSIITFMMSKCERKEPQVLSYM